MNDIRRVIKGYRAFRESTPRRAAYYNPRLPRAVWRMGPCEFVGYMTTHAGRAALYVHEFAPGSRPMLYAGPHRSQLYVFGGRFIVNGHGITDLDIHGRIVDRPRRYKIVPIKRPRLR